MSVREGAEARALLRLIGIMRRLRDPHGGCAWDLAQDFSSIAPYTIEEAYEVAEAIERGEPSLIREELGDLLFQVVFHARLAEERSWFGFADVAEAISDKLEKRHPHVFASAPARDRATQSLEWEAQKAHERRAQGLAGTLGGVALALPALQRAAKLGRRAARVGFDWEQSVAVRAKVLEELAELDEALGEPQARRAARVAEELGDLLFAISQWARHLEVDPEDALRRSNRKFERRFARIEQLCAERGIEPAQLDAAGWDALWGEAKAEPDMS